MRFDQHHYRQTRQFPGIGRIWAVLTAASPIVLAWLALLACVKPVWAQASTDPSGGSQPAASATTDVVLGSTSFQIPFKIASSGSSPREVHLYVAKPLSDRDSQPGQWRLLDRQQPDAGVFQLEETPDGVFLFATRTIDQTGRAYPPGPIQPELRVVVDTQQPEVDLHVDTEADGSVSAKFSITDATPAKQMMVHYVTDTTRKWQVAQVQRDGHGGRFAFHPRDNWQQMSVRVSVLDQAGNETIVTKTLKRPRIATKQTTRFAAGPNALTPENTHLAQGPLYGGPGSGFPPPANGFPLNGSFPQGLSSPLPSGSTEDLPAPATAEQISNDFGRSADVQSFDPSLTEANPTQPDRPQTAAEAMRPLNVQRPSFETEEARPQPSLDAPADPSRPLTQELLAPGPASPDPGLAPETPFVFEEIPAPLGQESSRDAEPTNRPHASDASSENVTSGDQDVDAVELNKPATGTPARTFPDSDSAVTTPWTAIDPNEPKRRALQANPRPSRMDERSNQISRRPASEMKPQIDLERLAQRAVIRHSDSNQFSLDYELEGVGGRGVDSIELYGSTDGGQTWKLWGIDPDRKSPFDIETNGEGIFGFQIVVVASNGLASPRPLGGDFPDIVVVVDEDKPKVSITGARYGEGDRAGSLVINYKCEDQYLTSRPITLAFSDSVQGPWTTIAAGLRNIGDHVWPADPQLPRQIYLRIDATDLAGNIGSYVLEEPIDTRGLAPRARIRAFRAIPN